MDDGLAAHVDAVVRAVDHLASRADRLLDAARRCAAAVHAGHGLVVDAGPERRAHAEHVAVEFVHPVIAGRRAVPALVANGPASGRDLRLWLGPGPIPAPTAQEREIDLGAIAETDAAGPDDVTMVLVHHLLWELTHAHLDRDRSEGYLASLARPSNPPVRSDDVVAKVVRSSQTIRACLDGHGALLTRLADEARAPGRRIWTFGQGGSAADAALAADRLGGHCLATNPAVLTALVNDLGADEMYVRQVGAHVRSEDLVIALTTSGASPAVLRGLAAARRIGARTVALTGHGGLVDPDAAGTDVVVVGSDSVHRIQEAHLAVVDVLARLARER